MIVCKHCSSKNGLESRFCNSCGLELSDEERDRAKSELDSLVADGYSLLGQGRTEEAALVAEKVLGDAPNFAEALSLLGMCHERNHDSVAALECYERVVDLRPESALDKIKVQQLRNVIARGAKEEKPNRAMALVGACAAVVVMASLGGIVATLITRPAAASTVADNSSVGAQNNGAPFSRQEQIPNQPVVNTKEQTDSVDTPPGPNGVPPVGSVRPATNDTRHVPDYTNTRPPITLPEANGETDEGNKPVDPGLVIVPTKPPTAGPPDDNPPQPDQGPGIKPVETGPAPEDPNKGIEIKVTRGGSGNLGGSQPVGESSGESLTALLKYSQDQFLLGKFSNAASGYEKALRSGGDPGRISQRLGQCYEKLNKKSDAIQAYSRAESSLQAAVNGGKASAKPALESVRAALQVLRGN